MALTALKLPQKIISENPLPDIINTVAVPLPQGAIQNDSDFLAENLVTRFYTLNNTPEDVVTFYVDVLPSKGWTVEQPLKSEWDAKAEYMVTSAVFTNSQSRVRITAGPNQHNPSVGATSMNIEVLLR